MTKCRVKHRTRTSKKKGRGSNHPSNKGHSWTKLFNDDGEHIGRKCDACNIVILNPRGMADE